MNHQWAKSTTAEVSLGRLRGQAGITSGCFSLLRGMGELEISRWFAAIGDYDDLFSSCNVVVRSNDPDRTQRWCRDCAKCRWVFLVLASVMTRSRVVGIVGRDLLDDRAQVEGYRELLGLVGHKPMECVGEIVEARVALAQLAGDPQWRDTAVVRSLAARSRRWPARTPRARGGSTGSSRYRRPTGPRSISSPHGRRRSRTAVRRARPATPR